MPPALSIAMALPRGDTRAAASLAREGADVDDSPSGCLVIHLTGELDVFAVPQLRPALERLLEHSPGKLVVDISGLKLLDCSGVGILVYLLRQQRAADRGFRVAGAREQPLRLLRLMKLDLVLLSESD
jgi:anti-sigma B factor antagonist